MIDHDKLDEYENVLKIAVDDLGEAVDAALDVFGPGFEEIFERVDVIDIKTRAKTVVAAKVPQEDRNAERREEAGALVDEAFSDFLWAVGRAWRAIKKVSCP